MNTVERARGRWHEILPALGIDRKYLVNRHGPCPICGGRDRFRYDDKAGTGSYYCSGCGPGSGIVLVRRANNWTFKEAADAIDTIIGTDPPSPRATPKAHDPERRRNEYQRRLDRARDHDLVRRYLTGRGLNTFPDVLVGEPAMPYMHEGTRAGYLPAMLAPVLGPDGALRTILRTYLADVPGARKKLMPPVEELAGGAVRLFAPSDVLGVAEGVETALAAHELFGVPTWATIGTAIMESWQPPPGVSRVIVLADHDQNYAGQKAAFTLAHRLAVAKQWTVEVKVPPEPGDWLDVLNAGRARRAA